MHDQATDHALTAEKLAQIDGHLADYEAARAAQLAGIDTSPDEVNTAYRETVGRLLAEIRLARRRIEERSYGACLHCGVQIPLERLEWRPWATSCTRCAA
jgi:RNA polymerase-binding transcription factor DksA